MGSATMWLLVVLAIAFGLFRMEGAFAVVRNGMAVFLAAMGIFLSLFAWGQGETDGSGRSAVGRLILPASGVESGGDVLISIALWCLPLMAVIGGNAAHALFRRKA